MTAFCWSDELKCGIVSIEFPRKGVVDLLLPPGHCTDMTGAIKLAKRVTKKMPHFGLWCVRTITSGENGNSYECGDDGKWVAYRLNRRGGRR